MKCNPKNLVILTLPTKSICKHCGNTWSSKEDVPDCKYNNWRELFKDQYDIEYTPEGNIVVSSNVNVDKVINLEDFIDDLIKVNKRARDTVETALLKAQIELKTLKQLRDLIPQKE